MKNLFQLDIAAKRVYGLDVLRAFAILSVMMGHSIGYVPVSIQSYYSFLVFDGVTIFFVLSGFLIGGILLRTLEKQPISTTVLKDFWIKRWVRTVPPYFLVLMLVCLLESLHYTKSNPSFKPEVVWRFFVFLQNFRKPHPYFFQEAWSLSVEEWFYLLIPPAVFLLLALTKLRPARVVLLVATTVLILVTAERLYKYLHFPPMTINMWDQEFRKVVITRLDSLMYGMIGAYWATYHPSNWTRHVWIKMSLGIAMLAIHQTGVGSGFGEYACVFSFSVISLGTLLVLPAATLLATGDGVLYRGVTHISLISYSMYLLNATVINNHLIEPVLYALHFRVNSLWFSVLGYISFWGFTILFSTLLYKYFEVPVMALRSRLTTR